MSCLAAARMQSEHEDALEHGRCALLLRGLGLADQLQWERAYLWSIRS